MPTPLTDADKILRNDTGKDIVSKLDDIVNAIQASNIHDAEDVSYDNSDSGLSATNVQDAIDEVVDDIEAIPKTASEIPYDNTTSELSATKVQGAIDEVEGRLDTAEGNITNLDNNKLDKTDPTSTGAFSHTGDATVSGTMTANDGFVGNLTGDVTGTASNATNADNATNAGNANTVNNLTVLTAVPANAVFTDTDELADLKDVEFTNLADGQVIVWNATAGKFKNITLPDPMVFRGSLGDGGTITTLPVDGSAKVGDTYKVITDGTYAGQTAKVGDTFICLTKTISANTWVYIPSGDEPSGTVTSIKIQANSPIVIDDDSPITTSGVRTLSHANSGATAGSYGDSTAQTPDYGATFKVPFITVDDKGHITSISEHTVKIPDSDNTDTTYTLGTDGNNLKLTPSSGSAQTVTVPYATNAGTVNSHTVNSDVPSEAVFTDTTNALGISYDPTTSGLSATNAQDAIDELRGLDPQIKTASGSIASFTDGSDDIPVSEYECDIVAQQASGTPTPDNPLPITGFSACDIGVDANYGGFVDFNQLLQNGNFSSTTGWSISNATSFATLNNILSYIQTTTGLFANPVSTNCNTLTDHIYLLTVNIKSISSAINARIRQPIITSGKAIPLNEWTGFSEIFKCTENNNAIAIQLDCVTDNEINLQNFMIIDLTQMFGISKAEEILTMEQQVSGSGVAFVKNLLYKDYYDYDVGTVGTIGEINNDGTGNTYIVEFGQTIYGGRLIYNNGQWSIEATYGFIEITGSEGLYLDTSPNVVALSGIPIPISQVDTSLLEPMSNYATYSTQGTGNFNNNEYGLRTTGIVYYKNTSCTTLTDFQTFFTNNHLQICYKLATPVIIPITSSTRVKTISGNNNIYSNTGDNSVKYFTENADEIAELVKAEIASTNTDYHEYSTEEKIVGKWIDGRTVYEKTLNVGAIASGTTFAHGISNLDWIIDYSMFGLYAGENKLVSPANGSSSSIGFVIAGWDSTNITFTKGNLSSNFTNCYCTIQYIKTT